MSQVGMSLIPNRLEIKLVLIRKIIRTIFKIKSQIKMLMPTFFLQKFNGLNKVKVKNKTKKINIKYKAIDQSLGNDIN
jgi:hypothetical protein